MNDFELFQSALDIEDPAARKLFLQSACADNDMLLTRVEALLASHEGGSLFLQTPVAEQLASAPSGTADTVYMGHGSTHDDDPGNLFLGPAAMAPQPDDADDEVPLGYLEPSTRLDSLGRLSHYEVLEVVGRGAFGTVLRAFDDKLQRVVALKVMALELASTSPARKRFIREAQASAAIRHEHVVSVYAVEEKPIPYLVMEYIPGQTLQQKLHDTGPLDVLSVLRLGTQIAEGLAAAHAKDLIHRDIKPGNILLEAGLRDRVKITDFGLARAADDASMTQSGVIAGTPMYMAPEQALGHKLDQRADLFSLGSVLYQMVSGRPPFRASTTLAVLKRLTEEQPRPIEEIIPETPHWLCAIIAKLHAKNPDERYQSAQEVVDVLSNCEAQLKEHSKLRDLSLIPHAKSKRAVAWQWVAAAALLFPLVALGLYAFNRPNTSLTVAQDGTKPPAPESVTRNSALTTGWTQLFNGKDLTGWKTHPDQPGNWKVDSGVLVGSTIPSYLFSDGGKFANFHLRIEAKVSRGGDSGIFFRTPFSMRAGRTADQHRPAAGYEVEIQANLNNLLKTGSVWDAETEGSPPKALWRTKEESLIQADEWFTLEIIAEGNRIISKVNGIQTADCSDPQSKYEVGHLALQIYSPQTLVQFRKIEIKELPPNATTLPPTFKNTLGMEFVIVPKGKSWLGGGQDKPGDQEVEFPADFYLGKYEVTQEEWEKVMGENPSHFSRTGGGMDQVKDIPDADLKRFPVEMVSWDQCQIFVAKLNQLEKETGWVYRLPKEAEWEYACRGGPMLDKEDGNFDFYFSKPTNNLLPEQANFNNGLNRTCKVDSYEPNVLGLYDMHGNVWQWCDDNEKASDGTSRRVGRGGGWAHAWGNCRAAYRFADPPSSQQNLVGLRLARVPSGAPSPGGFALAFDGENSVVRIPSLKIVEDHALTAEAWAVLEQTGVSNNNTEDLLGNAASSGFCLSVPYRNGGKTAFSIRLKNPDDYFVAWEKQVVPRHQLIHFAGVYDGKTEIRYYVNGQLQSRTPAQRVKASDKPVALGNNQTGTSGFLGRMNGVRLSKVARYDTDFTPAQRWEPDTDTLALYHFEEGEGTVLKDSSGNGHHGEIVGAKWVKADGSPIGSPPAAQTPPLAADVLKDAVLLMSFEKETFYEKDGKIYVRDLSGNGNDGLCENVEFTSDGKAGGGLECKGGSLQLPKSLINRQPNYTIALWGRRKKNENKLKGPNEKLFLTSKAKEKGAVYAIEYQRDGRIYTAAYNLAKQPNTWLNYLTKPSVALPEDEWFFLTVALSGGDTEKGDLRVVVNDLVSQGSLQWVGAHDDKSDFLCNGLTDFVLDEVAIFQRALSDEEIAAVRAVGLTGTPLNGEQRSTPLSTSNTNDQQ